MVPDYYDPAHRDGQATPALPDPAEMGYVRALPPELQLPVTAEPAPSVPPALAPSPAVGTAADAIDAGVAGAAPAGAAPTADPYVVPLAPSGSGYGPPSSASGSPAPAAVTPPAFGGAYQAGPQQAGAYQAGSYQAGSYQAGPQQAGAYQAGPYEAGPPPGGLFQGALPQGTPFQAAPGYPGGPAYQGGPNPGGAGYAGPGYGLPPGSGPGYGPPPGYGPGLPGYGPGQPSQGPRPFDGYAITALIFGVLGGIIAIPFGIASLRARRRLVRRGYWMAIVGLSLTGVWALILVLGLIGQASQPTRNANGTVTSGGYTTAAALRVGDCLTVSASTGLSKSEAVHILPCSSSHNAQVYAVVTLTDSSYPGQTQIQTEASSACAAQIPAFVGSLDLSKAEVYLYFPFQSSWNQGDHKAQCLLIDPSGPFTGDIRSDPGVLVTH